MNRIDLGGAHPRAAVKVRDHMEPIVSAFIANAPFLVMSTSNR